MRLHGRSVEERFWRFVHKTPTCWLWTGSKTAGYGHFGVNGRLVRAHRYAYELLIGPIPPDKPLDHHCFNRACCNPAHLEPVSHAENVWRRKGANPGSTSRWRGVSWDSRRSKWTAQVRRHGKVHHLGRFADELDAARAAAEKYLELGEPKPLADLNRYLQANFPGTQLEMWSGA